jgi:hypothetical protein
MHGAGDHFLARAALTADEHVAVALGDGHHLLLDAAHGGAVAHQAVQADEGDAAGGLGGVAALGVLEDGVLTQQATVLDGPLDADQELVPLEGLGHVVEGAGLDGLDGRLDRGERRHEHHRQFVVELADGLDQFDARHAGHLEIGNHAVGLLPGDHRQGRLRAVGRHNFHPRTRQGRPHAVTEHLFVVHNQHHAHAAHPFKARPWAGHVSAEAAGNRQNCAPVSGNLPPSHRQEQFDHRSADRAVPAHPVADAHPAGVRIHDAVHDGQP